MASWVPPTSVALQHSTMHSLRRAARSAGRVLISGPTWQLTGRAPGVAVCVAPRALTTRHNPFDFDSAPQKDRLLARLETSVDEADEPRRAAEQGREECKAAALRMLGVRAHSARELRAKLLDKGYEQEVVRSVLQRLKEVGLQSDEDFAEVFARSKWRQCKWGPPKLRSELSRRGVAQDVVDSALQSVFGEGLDLASHLDQLADEQYTASCSSSSSVTSRASAAATGSMNAARGWTQGPSSSTGGGSPERELLAQARRQFSLSRGLGKDARRRRLVGWLQRRGHSWDNISRLLHQLEREDALATIDAAPPAGEE